MSLQEDEVDALVADVAARQRALNEQREAMAEEIVSAQPLANIDEARRFAKAWIVTAAQHCDNECYWRDRALAAEGAVSK